MHTRHDRAAVDTTEARRPAARRSASPSTTLILWAERPLAVRHGRLTAVRLRGEQLQVRLVDRLNGLSRWSDPDGLITEFQAAHWVANSRFHA